MKKKGCLLKGCALTLLTPLVILGILLGWILIPAFLPTPDKQSIYDRQGRTVLYHGVNISNYSKYSEDFLPWHTREDLAPLQDHGFNLVRYLVFWEAIEPEPGHYNEAYIEATLERIGWLEEIGVDVLVDLHQDLYARRFTGNGFPDWTVNDGGHAFTPRQPWSLNYSEPAVRASYHHFWHSHDLQMQYAAMLAYLGTRLEGCPNVIGIDVMNEPWPSPILGFERKVLSPFYEKLQQAKRDAGFTIPLYFEPVIYTSTGVRSRLRFNPDPDAGYSAHYYDPLCHEGIRYTAFGKLLMRAGLRMRMKEAARFGIPLIITEFGISTDTPGYAEWLGDFVMLFRQHDISWTYYGYDKVSISAFGLLDPEGQPRYELLDLLISVYPQRVAGNNIETRYDEHQMALAYDPIDTDAPTVIAIPASFAGAQIDVNGTAMSFDPASRRFEHHSRMEDGRQTIAVTW